MTDDDFVDNRYRPGKKETRQTRLRDGFVRFETETRLDEVQDDD